MRRDRTLSRSVATALSAKLERAQMNPRLLGLCLVLCLTAAVRAADDTRLVVNGSFEDGAETQPEHWSKLDGLTTIWDSRGKPGKCLRFDPTVLQVDKKAHQKDPGALKARTRGGQYSTVGAHEGVWVWSQPIRVDKSHRYYIIEADAKGPKSTELFYPQIFLRGYQEYDPERDGAASSYFHVPHEGGPGFSEVFGKQQRQANEGDFLQVWRSELICGLQKADEWQHFRMGIRLHPKEKFRPDVILLKVYAMWPLGDYFFDNIAMRTATEDEYRAAKLTGHKSRSDRRPKTGRQTK